MAKDKFFSDVDVDADGNIGVGANTPTTFAGGAKSVTDTAAALSTVTKCKGVWVGAPLDTAGDAANSQTVYVGDASNQKMPIVPTDGKGFFIPISSAATVFIVGKASGDSLNYHIFV